MDHHEIVVRDEEKRRLRVHNNVRQYVSVSLSREGVVYAFPTTYPVEGMQDAAFGVLKNVFTRARSWLEAKDNRRSPYEFCVSRP